MLLETGVLLKMQSDCLPAGGAVRAVTSGFPSNGCNLSSSAHERYFIRLNENAIKTILKTVGSLQKYTHINHTRRVLILKHAVLMFIHRSQTPQINNTGNVYWNIGNVFKNHITVIEKNYIAILIDIELLSSPTQQYLWHLTIHLERVCGSRRSKRWPREMR